MAKILRTHRPDYGGLEVTVAGDDTPVYLAPGTPAFIPFEKTGVVDQVLVDAVIAERQAGKAESDKRAAVDAALDAEYQKRKAAVDYSKSGVHAVTAVFGVAKP